MYFLELSLVKSYLLSSFAFWKDWLYFTLDMITVEFLFFSQSLVKLSLT